MATGMAFVIVAASSIYSMLHDPPIPPPGSCGYDNVTSLPGMNIDGDDYIHFQSPSVQDCLQRCCGDVFCNGFTFTSYQPGLDNELFNAAPDVAGCPTGSPCCWFKKGSVGTFSKGTNLTSAVVVHPPTPPLPPPPPVLPNRPTLVPTTSDCRVREVALLLATKLRPDAVGDVHDAFQMDTLCNTTKRDLKIAHRPCTTIETRTSAANDGAVLIYVDGVSGSDSAPGTEALPVHSIPKALALARASSSTATILLKANPSPYELDEPIYLGPSDSGLTLTSYGGAPGDRAEISGARTVQPQWQSIDLPGRKANVYMASNLAGNFTTMIVDGKRQILARFPNADTEIDKYPAGTSAYSATWKMPPNAVPDNRVIINQPNRTQWIPLFGNGTGGGGNMAAFYEYVDGGSANRFTPPICPGPPRSCCSNNFPYCGVPGSISFNATAALGKDVVDTLLRNNTGTSLSWTPSPLMNVHGWWTVPVWYNLIFGVGGASYDAASGIISFNFSRGGNQASQGARSLNNWWIEGDLGLLDAEGEWYHENDTLWYIPNGTNTEPPTDVVLSEQLSLVNVMGTSSTPVTDVTITDIDFSNTAAGWFEPFEALGGGDQAIHRGGAVFAEGVERFTVANGDFVNIGGNGIVISGYSRDSTVSKCTLKRFGAAAIIVAGHANLIDLTAQNHPINTTIVNNVAFDGGVYLKGYFGPLVLAKQQAAHIVGNVFYNAPRAAILFNDGALGGDVIENNLGFNTNQETSDTGVVYTYDRLVFKFLDPEGNPTVTPQVRTHRNNMFFSNYHTIWPIDHDDGSSYYLDEDNVLIYSGTKSFLGGHNLTTRGNLFLWPNMNGWHFAAMHYTAVPNESGYNEFWYNNTVLLGNSTAYGTRAGYLDLNACTLTDKTIPELNVANNTIYVPAQTSPDKIATIICGKGTPINISTWQSTGHDVGTKFISGEPSDDALVEIAKSLLGVN